MRKQRFQMKGREYDALTGWCRVLTWRAGARKAIKRGYRRRLRKVLRRQMREVIDMNKTVVIDKREVAEVPCCNCGKPVRVTLPYSGDVLCDECMQGGSSYVLRKE